MQHTADIVNHRSTLSDTARPQTNTPPPLGAAGLDNYLLSAMRSGQRSSSGGPW